MNFLDYPIILFRKKIPQSTKRTSSLAIQHNNSFGKQKDNATKLHGINTITPRLSRE